MEDSEPPLSREELAALRRACAPFGVSTYLPADMLLVLSRLDYVQIVLCGVEITPLGLERLTRENQRRTSS